MAPTISRQWRGGPADYAALCDYCDVRYLRSQLQKQSSGRLACFGPGTNSCGAGRDEVALDKLNADLAKVRYRPAKHRGGRFDRMAPMSMEDIFQTSLIEYWDARAGITATSEGLLTAWRGQKLGVTFSPETGAFAYFNASAENFYGRPAVQVMNFAIDTGTATLLLPSGARPYMGLVGRHATDITGAVQFFNGLTSTVGSGYIGEPEFVYSATYCSVAAPGGTVLQISANSAGTPKQGRLIEINATGLFSFRVGKAEAASAVNSPTHLPWNRATVAHGMELTLLVLADNPTAAQIEQFRTIARGYGGGMP